jgi:hypothetical protein
VTSSSIQNLCFYQAKAIYEDGKRRRKNLSIAWIDYQKAADNVKHSCIEKSIELVGVNSKIVRVSKSSMEKWNTVHLLKAKQEVSAKTLI